MEPRTKTCGPLGIAIWKGPTNFQLQMYFRSLAPQTTLVGWLVGWMDGWLVGLVCLFGWLVGLVCLFVCLFGWLVGWLVG